MAMDITTLKEIVCEAVTTRADELTCGECFQRVDTYAELVLLGKHAAQAMPEVYDHLAHCRECRQEVEVLVVVLGATTFASRL